MTVLAACSGGGAEVQQLPNTNAGNGGTTNYAGPPPSTEDVQRFKLSVWDNLSPDNRCGACHNQTVQDPPFVRDDDINLAYQAVGPIVNLSSPSESRMVQKVAGGHNCWLTSNQACADIIQGYITDWAGGALGGAGSTVQLIAPPDKDPGASKNFPADSALFGSTIYPLLLSHCSGCHTESSLTAQSPFFATNDVDSAYAAAQAKINLNDPTGSRFVIRLSPEFHNCWSANCAADSAEMAAAIQSFADGIPLTQLDPALIASKSLLLTDGILANTGGRHEDNVIAKWEFKTGSGTTAFDTSGVEPAMDLTLNGEVSWVGGWGIQIVDGKAQASTTTSKKLFDQITATGEYSIEAWVAPANVTQEGPAGIVSYSGGTTTRNFTLGQTLYNYDFLNRSSTTDANGEPMLATADGDERLQAALQHVVVTYSPTDGRKIYVNGVFTGDVDPSEGGNLSDWNDTFAFVLGNEVSSDRLWQGTIRMVAVHNRVLPEDQIVDNFKVGVGEKFFMLFGVSHLINVPESYIVYTVSQYDNFSYLFNKPFFISMDANAAPSNIDLEKIRIGINGREASVGQAYKNITTVLDSSNYDPAAGQKISDLGGLIALEKGPQSDEFFLTFEKIGTLSHTVVEPPPPPPAPAVDAPAQPAIGLRNFEEINATLSTLTTVPMTSPDVANTFNTVKQALPSNVDINTFASAQQMAVTQMAIS
ncbi:MAG TPA: LamG domain-containing protein, partial [Aeromonadales bacterium]|nr:LamG domain-containing protein [Aeromonadales bacterium]